MGKKSLNIFVGLNDSRFQKGMNRVQKRLGKFGKSMKQVGGNLTRSVSMPLALAGGAAVKMAVDFQTSLTKIQTLVGATATEVKAYEQGIKSISSTTAVGQKELAEGLFFITSAGLKGTEALDTLDVAAKAAAMGMGEMDSVANALTSIMTAYADEGMSAAKAGDLLHETLKQGKFEAGEFMDKLGSVIPTAAAAGVSMEELGAASATMSKLSGDAAGTLTSMRALMQSLLKPSEKQKEILDSIGLSSQDLGSMMDESLMGTLQHLFGALEGNNEGLMNMFGSSKAVTGALATMGLQANTYKEVLDGMNNSQGNVEKGMKTISETAGHQMQQALVDLQNVGIEIGATLLPIVVKVVKGISNFITSFSELEPKTKGFIIALGLVAGGLGPMLTLIGSVSTALSMLSIPMLAATAGFTAIAVGIAYLTENWTAFIGSILKTGPTITKIVSGLIKGISGGNPALLATAATLDGMAATMESGAMNPDDVETEWKGFGETMEDIGQKIKTAMAAPFQGGGSVVPSGGGDEGGGFTPIQSIAPSGGGGMLTATLKTSGEEISKFSDKMMGFFTDMEAGWESFGETAAEKIQSVGQVFADIVGRMGAISDQRFKNEFMNLDLQTEKEVQAVENSKMTAEQKEAALTNIQKTAGEKRREIQRRQAKAEKKQAIFQAIIATAVAVAQNIGIPPLAAAIGILGAAQVAAISSQPLPALAEGGLAFGPTAALVGDNVGAASDPEVIAPLSKLQGMLNNGTQAIEVYGVLRGEDIWLANNKQGTRQARIG